VLELQDGDGRAAHVEDAVTAPPNPTLDQLQAILPKAHIETTREGEVVIYTGWALDTRTEDPQNAPLGDWEAPF
jgi:hypothetical protein